MMGLLSMGFLFVLSGSGASWVWDQGGDNNSWSTAANWDPNTVPISANTTDVTFNWNVSNRSIIRTFGDRKIRMLTFGANLESLDNTFELEYRNNLVPGTFYNLTFEATSGNSLLTVENGIKVGYVTLRATDASKRTILNSTLEVAHNDAETPLEIAGAVTGAGGLLKTGPGTLILSGVCSYTGGTIVSNGVLRIEFPSGATLDQYGVLDLRGGQVIIPDETDVRIWAMRLVDSGQIKAYNGSSSYRVKFGSVANGSDLVLSAENIASLAKSPSHNNIVNVSCAPQTLTWTAGTGATSHRVYFDGQADTVIDGSASAFKGSQTSTSYTTPALYPYTVYYWRVDEVAGGVTNRGDVWSFRTVADSGNGNTRPTLGVIRWDMYHGREESTQKQELGYLPGGYGFLAPTNWNWRAPFFCYYTNDVPPNLLATNGVGPLWFNWPMSFQTIQKAMVDPEIAFAGTAGAKLDYWIFGGVLNRRPPLSAFLLSERSLEMNYSMMYLFNQQFVDACTNVNYLASQMVWHAKRKNYQTVPGGRPIFFLLDYKELSKSLGDPPDGTTVVNLANYVQGIRNAFSAASLPNPYLVATALPCWVRDHALWVNHGGFDAHSEYKAGYGGSTNGAAFSGHYAAVSPYWSQAKNILTTDSIPNIMCGDDKRPRKPLYDAVGATFEWYQEPVPGDLTSLMNRAMDYVSMDRSTRSPANTLTMYAWNEHSEGGFLCPLIGTNEPDTWRLDEVSLSLNSYAYGNGKKLVLVRDDGNVYTTPLTTFSPVLACNLTTGTLIAAAADGPYVYGLNSAGTVYRADLDNGTAVETLGTFSGITGLKGLDVKAGQVFVITTNGVVYKNFGSAPVNALHAASTYKDIAAKSSGTYCGLYGNSPDAWGRTKDNAYTNFSNASQGVALSSEESSVYYALRDDGYIATAYNVTAFGPFGTATVDLTVNNRTNLYTIATNGEVKARVNGTISTLGTAPSGSDYIAIDIALFADLSLGEFTDSFDGWIQGGVNNFALTNGTITGTANGNDPKVIKNNLSIPLGYYSKIKIRMWVQSNVSGQGAIYYSTTDEPSMSVNGAIVFTLTPGVWKEYVIDASAYPNWTSDLTSLRIDPFGGDGNDGKQFNIDYVRLAP
jgi:autotransporter-associated beta strand protein